MNISVHIYYTSYSLLGSSDAIAYIISNDLEIPAISLVSISPWFIGSGTYIVTLSAETVDEDKENDISTINTHIMTNFNNIFYTGCTINIIFCASTTAASLIQCIASLINWKLSITKIVYATAPTWITHLPMANAWIGNRSSPHNSPDASKLGHPIHASQGDVSF